MVAPIYDTVELGIASLIVSVLLSYALTHQKLWTYRKLIAALNSMFIGLSSGFLVLAMTPVIALLFVTIQLGRLFISLRTVKDRLTMPQSFARTRRSERYFIAWVAVCVILGLTIDIIYSEIILLLVVMQLGIVVILFRHTMYMQRATTLTLPKKFQASADLPSVTIAIPARNQTIDLEDCLRSALRINYPKLEILVLDDCSQDKTSDIIRSFAHKGVRFLKGTPPPASWVAKKLGLRSAAR